MSRPSYPRQHLILSDDTTKLLEVVFEKGQVGIFERKKKVIVNGMEEFLPMSNQKLHQH
jgi:hypothetical protein